MAKKRTPLIAGNWKMNTTSRSCRDLILGVQWRAEQVEGVEKVVCPPFPYLSMAAELLRGTSLKVGAQNMHWEEKGAFTGEVSIPMLAELVEYVIIGHSERRAYFGETDETVNKKLRAALAAGLKPILCVGEVLEQREAGETEAVLVRQVSRGLEGLTLPRSFAIAYEPVWAIGTGRAATGDMANEAIALIRRQVAAHSDGRLAASVRILYGGSVTADNITEFADQPDIDGALVGGASLDAIGFSSIIEKTAVVSAGK
jgi:triosephosphate isomerase